MVVFSSGVAGGKKASLKIENRLVSPPLKIRTCHLLLSLNRQSEQKEKDNRWWCSWLPHDMAAFLVVKRDVRRRAARKNDRHGVAWHALLAEHGMAWLAWMEKEKQKGKYTIVKSSILL